MKHLPMEVMWFDVNTKPKTGPPFQQHCAKIMFCPINVPDENMQIALFPGICKDIPFLKYVPPINQSQASNPQDCKSMLGIVGQ
jgi:hypothetical protein